MASWIKNVKDGSRRLKDEFVRSIGAGGEDIIDPVLEYRTQRFNRYNESLEKLAKAMAHYMQTTQAYSHASMNLMHSFSVFFETQLQDYSSEEDDFVHIKSLAQSSLRLEEIQQSLRENIFSAAHEMQLQNVVKSIQRLKQTNAGIQTKVQALKQKLMDYDSVRRTAESQKKNTPDYERLQQKVQMAEATLATLTNSMNSEMNALEARRGVDMRNELLTVVACQLFVHSRAKEHLEQLIPLLPGIARPLFEITEHSRARPYANPAETDVMGVIHYAGPDSRGVVDLPLSYHGEQLLVDVAYVHPLETINFTEIHFAEKLAMATYGKH